MLKYPNIDPVALKLGPLKIHWYGITYLVGFIAFLVLGRMRASRPGAVLNKEQVSDFLFYGVLGVIIGGRLGSVLFYNFDHFIASPSMIFRIWEGGMSFHGGLIGVIVAAWIYQRRQGIGFLRMGDFIAPLVPIGLGSGRIGNFINGELWGKVSDVPWAMVFPTGGPDPRHPSQLYQAGLEGVALFVILWLFSSKPRPAGAVSGLFLVCYGAFRFVVEFVRVPDADIGYLAFGWVTMGQVLSLPMILLGIGLMIYAYKNNALPKKTAKA